MLAWNKYLLLTLALLLGGCLDRFEADVIKTPPSLLVVGGFINLSGVSTIELTRSQALATTGPPPAETGATVLVRDEAGTAYPLAEQEPGVYRSASLQLNPAGRYQVYLRTAAGREYASDLVAGKPAPPIDAVTWASEGDQVKVLVNTHDASGSSRYYRWRYTETWEFRSYFESRLEYVNDTILPRTENIYNCWASESSTALLLGNTTRLTDDVVAGFPLLSLPASSVKLGRRYSVLVQQQALSAAEYAYWEALRKNTEAVGSLFDPQPTRLTGNVRSLSEPAETVIGYVGASSVTERRIFISRDEFPLNMRFQTGYEACAPLDTVLLRDVPARFGSLIYLPIYPVYIPRTSVIIGYASSTAACLDCRRRGTNQKPAFWP